MSTPLDLNPVMWLDYSTLIGTTDRAPVAWADSSGNGNDPLTDAGFVPIWDAVRQAVISMTDDLPPSSAFWNGYWKIPPSFPVASNACGFFVILQTMNARRATQTGNVDAVYLMTGASTTNLLREANGKLETFFSAATHGDQIFPTSMSLLGMTAGASEIKVIVNDASETFSTTPPSTNFGGASTAMLGYPSVNVPWQGRVKHILWFDRELNPTEIGQLQTWAQTQGVNFAPTHNIVLDGDSIGVGAISTPFNGWFSALNLPAKYRQYNMAESGITLATCISQAAALIDTRITAGAVNICVCEAGVNDIQASASASDIYNNYVTYGTARKSAGFDWMLFNGLTPVTSSDTTRQALRTLMLADFSVATSKPNVYAAGPGVTYGNYYLDIAANADIGAFAQRLDPTWYFDQIHPTTLGHSVYSGMFRAMLDLIDPPAPSGNALLGRRIFLGLGLGL